jgi:hypothetical protein
MSLQEFAQQFRFDPVPVEKQSEHLPTAVASALPHDEVVVFSCLDEYSDTAAFSARYGLGLDDCANTLILKYTKNQGEHYAAVVTLGSRRLDINGAVNHGHGVRWHHRVRIARRHARARRRGSLGAQVCRDGSRISRNEDFAGAVDLDAPSSRGGSAAHVSNWLGRQRTRPLTAMHGATPVNWEARRRRHHCWVSV